VAEARMRGDIGEKEKQGRTKQEISKIDAATAVLETERQGEKAAAEAQLATKRTELDMHINLAKIKAKRMAEQRDAEMQKEVETKRADMELERQRATDVVKSKIAKETAMQKADAQYYAEVKGADAQTYSQGQTADAQFYSLAKATDGNAYKVQKDAEAAFYRKQKEAEAAYYAKKKEAEGIAELAQAYGHLANVLGGPQGLMQYLMIQDGTYEKLAKANAQAINGLQPKITIWNTGAQGEGSMDTSAPIRNLFQSLPPLLSTINEQTGIQPPSWLMQMPQEDKERLAKQYLTNGKGEASGS
jgi:flotillin